MSLMNRDLKKAITIQIKRNPLWEFKSETFSEKIFVETKSCAFFRAAQLSRQTTKKKIDKNVIDDLLSFENILEYFIENTDTNSQYFSDRIFELKKLCNEENYEISLDSLKALILFVGKTRKISKPNSLTVSDDGLFYLKWKKDRNNLLTLRFKEDYFSDYVIFKPSSYISKRTILSDSIYVLDLIDYLKDLKIKIHQNI